MNNPPFCVAWTTIQRSAVLAAVVVAIGSAPLGQAQSYAGSTNKTEQMLNYLSSKCRNIYDLANKRPQSGASQYEAQRIQEASQRFNDVCSEEMQAANDRVYTEQRAKQRQRVSNDVDNYLEKAEQQQGDARSRSHCLESRRVVAAKRQRTDLTPGELQDLARFEENVKARCPITADGAKK